MPLEISITRMAATNEAEKKKRTEGADDDKRGDNRTMGRKHIVPYGLYRVHAFVNAKLAQKTGFSAKDLELIKQALGWMYELDRSAARGEMAARRCIAFRHDSDLGNEHAHKLFERVTVHRVFEGTSVSVGDKRSDNWPTGASLPGLRYSRRQRRPAVRNSCRGMGTMKVVSAAREDDFIPLSAWQHYLFCPRQCALIHVEQAWAENRFTAEGRVLHEATAEPGREKRRGVRVITAMPVVSRELGVSEIADLVEMHRGDRSWRPFPVEYKRGEPKTHSADEVQLCAQAMALEEMFSVTLDAGALFYGETRHRLDVALDEALHAYHAVANTSAMQPSAKRRTGISRRANAGLLPRRAVPTPGASAAAFSGGVAIPPTRGSVAACAGT